MNKIPNELGLKKRFAICLRVLKITLSIRPLASLAFFVAALVEVVSFVIAMYATAKIISILAIYLSTGNNEGLWFWFWVNIVAIIATAAANEVMSFSKRLVYFGFVTWSTNDFLQAVSKVDINKFYEENYRNQLNKVSGSYYWQMSELAYSNLDIIYGFLRLGVIFVLVSQIQWWILPVIILFLIPSLVWESRLATIQWFINDEKGDERQIINGLELKLREALSLMEIRTLQIRTHIIGVINRLNQIFYSKQEREYKLSSRYVVAGGIAGTAGTAIGSIVLIFQVLDRTIGFDRYLFLSASLLRIEGALVAIFGTLARMQEKINFADSYFSITDTLPEIIDKKQAHSLPPGKVPAIKFENVSFTYPNKEAVVFQDLNLTIKAGEHIALVGENGAGKSTLIKLLLRLYQPTSGSITLDGKNINDIDIESWYDKITTLFQDFNSYPLSIAENIEIGRSNIKSDKKRLLEAAKFTGIDTAISNYRYGFDTVLDSSFEKGIEPSGGQWQRVALSRAFYRNGDFLILDEPTAAIDAKAEYDIFNNIFDHYQNKTVIIVSHRFSTVRRADRILVLEEGNIVEQGSHEELMKNKRLYYELFTKQAEGYR